MPPEKMRIKGVIKQPEKEKQNEPSAGDLW